jgi:3',5'-cyclic AMP phosphodiesterase CpdA
VDCIRASLGRCFSAAFFSRWARPLAPKGFALEPSGRVSACHHSWLQFKSELLKTQLARKSKPMATILHLTDLHLSQPSQDTALGDYKKITLLPPEEFQSRKSALEASIDSLGAYLIHHGIELDSIVVTGDVTVASEPDGYKLLEPFLERLGGAMVESERVLLTPGNHDVRWATEPGSRERYEALTDLRSQTGYRTALLDGIDIDGEGRLSAAAHSPSILAKDGSFHLVGLNSSNHCGVESRVDDTLAEYVAGLEKRAEADHRVAALLQDWRRRGLHDLARLDHAQLLAAGREWRADFESSVDAPIRIAALHHQISPVTDIEEVKPFEVMSNLGAFREWLVAQRVDIVLHGHAHVAFNRHDSQRSFQSSLGSVEHRFLVLGGGTVERGAPHAPMANLITISEYAPRFRPVRVKGLRAVTSKRLLGEPDFNSVSAFVRGDIEQAAGIIGGSNVEQVFEQLIGLGDLSDCVRPLVCRIEDGQSALRLPSRYPDQSFSAEQAKSWLGETVAWWQRAPRGPGATFNHGERLRQRDGEEFDQIEHAALALASDPSSSRAVAVLVHPRKDLVDKARFPSFVMLHATVTGVRSALQLDVVAYFRKQEIPHWWPVNMAELATIQGQMVEIIRPSRPGITSGSITSVTSIPVAGEGIPFVGVPWLDRNADNPRELLSLVAPILSGDIEKADEAWTRAMADWAMGDTPPLDGEPVPLEGLKALGELLNGIADAFGPDQVEPMGRLDRSLRALVRVNAAYRVAQGGPARAAERVKWICDVREERDSIRRALANLRAGEVRDRSL